MLRSKRTVYLQLQEKSVGSMLEDTQGQEKGAQPLRLLRLPGALGPCWLMAGRAGLLKERELPPCAARRVKWKGGPGEPRQPGSTWVCLQPEGAKLLLVVTNARRDLCRGFQP